MLTILMGRAKTGKSDTVLYRIADLGDTGKQILLVPEHASHQAEIDLCRICGDTASRHAEVLSFRRLGDRVLTVTGGLARVSLDAGGKLLLLQKALGTVAPVMKVYRRPSQKSTFLQKLLDLFDELRSYDVSPEQLCAQAEETTGTTSDKLHDLGLLYAEYGRLLTTKGLAPGGRMEQLCDNLEASRYVAGKDLFLDGFTYFNAMEYRAIEIMLREARSVTVVLLGEPDSGEEVFRASLKTCGRLTELAQRAGCPAVTEVQKPGACVTPLDHVERYFFGENVPFPEKQDAVRIREADTAFSRA